MVAGGALCPPMIESFRVHEIHPSVSPSTPVTDIQIVSDETEEQFGTDIKLSENRPGMFRRMSYWLRSR